MYFESVVLKKLWSGKICDQAQIVSQMVLLRANKNRFKFKLYKCDFQKKEKCWKHLTYLRKFKVMYLERDVLKNW